MKKVILSAIAFFVLGLVQAAGAVESDDVLGKWNTEDRDAVIEIYGCSGKYCGRIVWVDKPVYSAEDKNGKEGQPRVDENNPDVRLRDRPIVGLQIMYDFSFDGEAAWKGGKIYDPEQREDLQGQDDSCISKCVERQRLCRDPAAGKNNHLDAGRVFGQIGLFTLSVFIKEFPGASSGIHI